MALRTKYCIYFDSRGKSFSYSAPKFKIQAPKNAKNEFDAHFSQQPKTLFVLNSDSFNFNHNVACSFWIVRSHNGKKFSVFLLSFFKMAVSNDAAYAYDIYFIPFYGSFFSLIFEHIPCDIPPSQLVVCIFV